MAMIEVVAELVSVGGLVAALLVFGVILFLRRPEAKLGGSLGLGLIAAVIVWVVSEMLLILGDPPNYQLVGITHTISMGIIALAILAPAVVLLRGGER